VPIFNIEIGPVLVRFYVEPAELPEVAESRDISRLRNVFESAEKKISLRLFWICWKENIPAGNE